MHAHCCPWVTWTRGGGARYGACFLYSYSFTRMLLELTVPGLFLQVDSWLFECVGSDFLSFWNVLWIEALSALLRHLTPSPCFSVTHPGFSGCPVFVFMSVLSFPFLPCALRLRVGTVHFPPPHDWSAAFI